MEHRRGRRLLFAALIATLGWSAHAGAGHDAEQMLRDRCAADWPDDDRKQQDCVASHMEAALRYMTGRRATMAGTPEREVFVRCFDLWTGEEGTDWLEAETCTIRQLETLPGSPDE